MAFPSILGRFRVRILTSLCLCLFGASMTGAAPADGPDAPVFREQSIYVPFERLHHVFEAKGRGVFLPYEEYMQLWKAARGAPAAATREHPADFLISSVKGTVQVSKDVVSVKATVRIEVFKEGWTQVPLSLRDAAVKWATVDGAPARLVPQQNGGTALLVNKEKGTEPKQIELSLDFAKTYATAPGRNIVTFAPPQAPVSQWDVIIPSPGVDVGVQPALAVTQAPEAADPEVTHVVAFVGATPQITIRWVPKAEGARGLEALASVAADTRVFVEEGVIRTRTSLAYAISRSTLDQLQVEVPAGHRVINVFDPNIREWSLQPAGETQRITADLFEPADEAQRLVVELEAFKEKIGDAPLTIPVVEALNVHRQQGTVVVGVADSLRAEALTRSGLLQLDAQELPPVLRPEAGNPPWDFAYRYASLPYQLELRVEKIQPRIVATSLLGVHLQPESMALDLLQVLDVQRAGVFQFALRVPDGYDVRNVSGMACRAGVTPASVDSHHRTNDGVLEVNLDRQAKGPVGLRVQLQRKLSHPALLTPTGETVSLGVPLVRMQSPFLASESGHLVVYSPESLRLDARTTEGLRAVSPNESRQGWRAQYDTNSERPALAFKYAEQPVDLALEAERRRPHVTVRQLLITRVEPGVVGHDVRLHAHIRYSGVKSLLVAVPEDRADDIRLATSSLRRSVVQAPEAIADIPEGMEVWELTGDTEMLGNQTIRLLWEENVEGLGEGAGTTIDIPRLVPLAVDRAWGQVVLAKAEFIDLQPVAPFEGLRSIDPQYDLEGGVSVQDAARAFEFHDEWALKVKVRRYEARDVKATSIERGLIRTVLTRGGVTSVQALYRMRSARQRLVVQLPENVSFDTRPVRLNGRPVALEEGGTGEFHIPLTGQDKNAPFLLELRYTLSDGAKRLQGPVFPNEPATQKVYLSIHHPAEQAYLGYTGPWHDEMVWALQGVSALPRPIHTPDWLLNWVSSGVSVGREEISEFATDGSRLLYSTLRPSEGRKGSLRLYTLRRAWLNLAILVAGIGLGLVLLPARAPRRLLVIGLVMVGMLVLDVFRESLAVALVTNASVSGAAIVLVLWAMKYLIVDRPAEVRRKRAASPPASPRPPPPPPQPAPTTPPQASKDGQPTNEPNTPPPPPDPHEAEEEDRQDNGQ